MCNSGNKTEMIKRKIILGFLFIGSLLFLSGVISSGELIRLNSATSELLRASRGNIELSKDMLDAVQEQNTLLLMSLTDTVKNYDSLIAITRENFVHSLQQTKAAFSQAAISSNELSNIERSATYYNNVVSSATDSMTMEWFVQVYRTTYNGLTVAIKDFMVANENSIIASAEKVESNAYRASMVGIIALSGGVLLLILFYFLLNNFFIRPVQGIERSLSRYLERGIPFSADITTKDELLRLRDNIVMLIQKSKSN